MTSQDESSPFFFGANAFTVVKNRYLDKGGADSDQEAIYKDVDDFEKCANEVLYLERDNGF